MNIIKLIKTPMLLGSLLLSGQVMAMQHDQHEINQHQVGAMPVHVDTAPQNGHQDGHQSHSPTIELTSPSAMHQEPQPEIQSQQVHAKHRQEHGGQIFQSTRLEAQWLDSNHGQGALKTEIESRIGTDENKLLIQAQINQVEAQQADYAAKILYSRNIAAYWDLQAGLRYRNDHKKILDQDQFDAVFGVQGLAPYFFETEMYSFLGSDDRYSLSLDSERDVLLSQKWILKPYFNADVILSDHSKYALQSGLSQLSVGLEMRFEITKKVMPYIDLSYTYQKGSKETQWQMQTASDKYVNYGAGIRFRF